MHLSFTARRIFTILHLGLLECFERFSVEVDLELPVAVSRVWSGQEELAEIRKRNNGNNTQ
jgi:hypothetical protein